MTYKEQAEFFGKDNRLNQLMEECGELISASAKYRRLLAGDKTLSHNEHEVKEALKEEIVDVYLVLDEVRHLEGMSLDELHNRIVYKMRRTEGRL